MSTTWTFEVSHHNCHCRRLNEITWGVRGAWYKPQVNYSPPFLCFSKDTKFASRDDIWGDVRLELRLMLLKVTKQGVLQMTRAIRKEQGFLYTAKRKNGTKQACHKRSLISKNKIWGSHEWESERICTSTSVILTFETQWKKSWFRDQDWWVKKVLHKNKMLVSCHIMTKEDSFKRKIFYKKRKEKKK